MGRHRRPHRRGRDRARAAWYFAEGYTGAGFDEYLTILNPNPTAAPVTHHLLPARRRRRSTRRSPSPASSRLTVPSTTRRGVGRGQEVGAKVETTNAGGIVVERPMYFRYGDGVVPAAMTRWARPRPALAG